jgi:hypothetical protein
MTTTSTLPSPETTGVVQHLETLLAARSKHSTYQQLHPLVEKLVRPEHLAPGKRETARWAFMAHRLPMQGLRVLDIGANTGYFSLGAVASGARHVTAIEGNAAHAAFVQACSDWLGWQSKLEVQPLYFEFEPEGPRYDLSFCLNVLHHLGDDFGDTGLSMDLAHQGIVHHLQALAYRSRHCWFQLGFNWKGQRDQPLFKRGRKQEVIDLVAHQCASHWKIREIGIYASGSSQFEPLCEALLERFDDQGEFLNRPLFWLESKVFHDKR